MNGLCAVFKVLKAPRIERCKLKLLDEILWLTNIAVICGAESYESNELSGKRRLYFLLTIMPLP